MWFLTLSSKNYAIWLIFECARAKRARKSWDLLHRSCWVTLEIHSLRTSPRIKKFIKGSGFLNNSVVICFPDPIFKNVSRIHKKADFESCQKKKEFQKGKKSYTYIILVYQNIFRSKIAYSSHCSTRFFTKFSKL